MNRSYGFQSAVAISTKKDESVQLNLSLDECALRRIRQRQQIRRDSTQQKQRYVRRTFEHTVHNAIPSPRVPFSRNSCHGRYPMARPHYNDVIMGVKASQITSLTIFYSTVYSDADQRKHQSSASSAFVRGIHRGPVNSPHKWPVTRKMFPFDDVFMIRARHYTDVIMGAIVSQITSLTIVYSTVYSGEDQRKHQSSASLAFVWGIHRGPVNSPHKWPVTRKMFPFDDVFMIRARHYTDVIMGAIASQITSLTIVYSTVYSGEDQRKHQSSASLAFVWGIHRGPVNSPHKWPVTRKMFPFDDVIMVRVRHVVSFVSINSDLYLPETLRFILTGYNGCSCTCEMYTLWLIGVHVTYNCYLSFAVIRVFVSLPPLLLTFEHPSLKWP